MIVISWIGHQIQATKAKKKKPTQVRVQQTKMLLYSNGNNQHNEKATCGMGEIFVN
jgi:hypothetical protein